MGGEGGAGRSEGHLRSNQPFSARHIESHAPPFLVTQQNPDGSDFPPPLTTLTLLLENERLPLHGAAFRLQVMEASDWMQHHMEHLDSFSQSCQTGGEKVTSDAVFLRHLLLLTGPVRQGNTTLTQSDFSFCSGR